MILNSLPKSGSNLITQVFEAIEYEKLPAITPTRFLKFNRNLIKDFMPEKVRNLYFYNIGFEIDAYIDISHVERLRKLVRKSKMSYIPSHFSNEIISTQFKQAGIPSIYTIRDPVDVYFSYLRYCEKEIRHTFYDLYHRTNFNAFAETLLYGGMLGNFSFLGWQEVLNRAVSQARNSDYVFNYSLYSKHGPLYLIRLCENISDTSSIKLSRAAITAAQGVSHTFRIGGNRNFVSSNRYIDLFNQHKQKFNELSEKFDNHMAEFE